MLIPMNGCVRLSVFPNRNRQRLMAEYQKDEKLTDILKKYKVNYCWGDKRYGIGVWGSYNSRLVTRFLITGSKLEQIFHYSNSSIVSLMSGKKSADGEFFCDNQYRKDALAADGDNRFLEKF